MGTAPPLTQEEERMFERYYLVGFWVGVSIQPMAGMCALG